MSYKELQERNTPEVEMDSDYYEITSDVLEGVRDLVKQYNALWEKENASMRQKTTTEEQDELYGKIEDLLEKNGCKADMGDGNFYLYLSSEERYYCLIFCDDLSFLLEEVEIDYFEFVSEEDLDWFKRDSCDLHECPLNDGSCRVHNIEETALWDKKEEVCKPSKQLLREGQEEQ